MPINTIVVGYGYAGRNFHSYLVNLVDGMKVTAVVTADPRRQATAKEERHCAVYATLDEALKRDGAELVVLATPNHVHCDLAVMALEAGRHVVTDKPMCLSLAECDRMIDASKKSGRLLSVFQNRRFDGDFLTVKKLRADGELGELRWVEMAWQGFGVWGGWRGTAAKGGGKYLDLGAHLVDQLLELFPQPIESVYCRMRYDDPRFDIETESLLVVTFADGCTGVCDTSSMAAIPKPRFYVRGTGATFVKYGLDPQEAAMNRGAIDEAVEDPANYGKLKAGRDGERVVPTLAGRWRSYYENIRDVIARGAEPVVKLDQARRVIQVLEAGRASARENRVVQVG